jgi:hypothetical protein
MLRANIEACREKKKSAAGLKTSSLQLSEVGARPEACEIGLPLF